MRKIWAFSFVLSIGLALSAQARVCFLPGVFGGDESCLTDQQYAECKGFERTSACPAGQEQVACVKDGKTYYHCYCRKDSYFLSDHPEYLCKTGYTFECGCAAENVVCAPEYIYKGDGSGHCKDYINSRGIDACILPNGEVYYKDCECDSEAFPYVCQETGFKTPTDSSDSCTDPHGAKVYSKCECDNNAGWSDNGCADREDGCSVPVSYNTVGGTTCWQCEEAICENNDLFNIESYLCGASKSVTFDCELLGYVYTETKNCPEGTRNAGKEGIRCPFDRRYMNCNDFGGGYPNERTCLEANEGAKECEDEDGDGYWKILTCKANQGYYKDGELCLPVPCPAGSSTSITSCTGVGKKFYNKGMSGGEICGSCGCEADDECIYTAQKNDISLLSFANSSKLAVYVGHGGLADLCCNGYYKTCYPLCSGRRLDEDSDPHMKNYETCDACGHMYYTITECENGYEIKDNACVSIGCNELDGYSTSFQSTSDCATADGLYEGGSGWVLTIQRDENNKIVRSEGKVCNKCVCSEPAIPSETDDCRWSVENKQKDGVLREEDLCCNGYYRNCYAGEIPSEATVEACNDENANQKEWYAACDGATRCIIQSCLGDYKVENNVCVPNSCPNPYTTDHQTLQDCGEGNGWTLDVRKNENGDVVKYNGLDCTQCVCSAAANCYYNDSNKGNATLSDKCCNEKYATCTSNCLGEDSLDKLVLGSGAIGTQGVNYTTCTGCGTTLYVLQSCKTDNGYELRNGKCEHVGCPNDYEAKDSDYVCSGEGKRKVVHDTMKDNGKDCVMCVDADCEGGYATSEQGCVGQNNITGDDVSLWKLGTTPNGKSGNLNCYQCIAKTCQEMLTDEERASWYSGRDTLLSGPTGCSAYDEVIRTTRYINGWCTIYRHATCADVFGEGYYEIPLGDVSEITCPNGGDPILKIEDIFDPESFLYNTQCPHSCYKCPECDISKAETYIELLCNSLKDYKQFKCAQDPETKCYTPSGGCASGYVSSKDECGAGLWKLTDVNTYNGVTCGKCTEDECPDVNGDHYARSVSKCGSTGANGYASLGEEYLNTGCYKCIAKTCSSYTCGNLTCQEDEGEKAGYSRIPYPKTIGENTQATCAIYTASRCPDGEATVATDCGDPDLQGAGWYLGRGTENYSGEQQCQECVAKGCGAGKATALSKCGTSGQGGDKSGWTLGTVMGYSGETACKQCNAKTCTTWGYEGTSCDIDEGYIVDEENDLYLGDTWTTCVSCTDAGCPNDDYATSSEGCVGQNEEVDTDQPHGKSAGVQCYKCVCKNGYEGEDTCVAKTCESYSSTYKYREAECKGEGSQYSCTRSTDRYQLGAITDYCWMRNSNCANGYIGDDCHAQNCDEASEGAYPYYDVTACQEGNEGYKCVASTNQYKLGEENSHTCYKRDGCVSEGYTGDNCHVKSCNEASNGAYPNDEQAACEDPKKISTKSSSTYLSGANSKYCWTDCHCNNDQGYYDTTADMNQLNTSNSFSARQQDGCYRYICFDTLKWYDGDNFNFTAWDYDDTQSVGNLTCYHKSGCKNGYATTTSYNVGCPGYKYAHLDYDEEFGGCYRITGCSEEDINTYNNGQYDRDRYNASLTYNETSCAISGTAITGENLVCAKFKKCKYCIEGSCNSGQTVISAAQPTTEVTIYGNVTCPIPAEGCQTPYEQMSNSTQTCAQKHDNTYIDVDSKDFTVNGTTYYCKKCLECKASEGEYSSCPSGFSCPTPESGQCFEPNSCGSDYYASNDSCANVYLDNSQYNKTEYIGTTETTCKYFYDCKYTTGKPSTGQTAVDEAYLKQKGSVCQHGAHNCYDWECKWTDQTTCQNATVNTGHKCVTADSPWSACYKQGDCDNDSGYYVSVSSNAVTAGGMSNSCYPVTGCTDRYIDINDTTSDKYQAGLYHENSGGDYYTTSGNYIKCRQFNGLCRYTANNNPSDGQTRIYLSEINVRYVPIGDIICPIPNGCKWGTQEDCEGAEANIGHRCMPATHNTGCWVPKSACDSASGYYDQCPDGASCPEDSRVNGCYVPTDCGTTCSETGCKKCVYSTIITPATSLSCGSKVNKSCSEIKYLLKVSDSRLHATALCGLKCLSNLIDTANILESEIIIDDDDDNKICEQSCSLPALAPTSDCDTNFGKYDTQAACNEANSLTLKKKESCSKIDGCWVAHCTQSSYSVYSKLANKLMYAYQECSYGAKCRMDDCDSVYRNGSYDDGCLATYASLVTLPVSGGGGYGDCVNVLEAYENTITQNWNSKCTTQITVNYVEGSISSNCSMCIRNQFSGPAYCISPGIDQWCVFAVETAF